MPWYYINIYNHHDNLTIDYSKRVQKALESSMVVPQAAISTTYRCIIVLSLIMRFVDSKAYDLILLGYSQHQVILLKI